MHPQINHTKPPNIMVASEHTNSEGANFCPVSNGAVVVVIVHNYAELLRFVNVHTPITGCTSGRLDVYVTDYW